MTAETLFAHALVRAGHKGLFFDRLDLGIVDGMTLEETPRLAVGADLLGYARNRVYSPRLGRWVQRDPNASGQVLIAGTAFHGSSASRRVDDFDLATHLGDGSNSFAYLGSATWENGDSLGLSSDGGLEDAAGGLWEAEMRGLAFLAGAADPGGMITSMLRQMATQYAANQDWDVYWASSWSSGDADHTRGNAAWIKFALVIGAADHFGLDWASFGGDTGPAMAGGIIPSQLFGRSGTLQVLRFAERQAIASGAMVRSRKVAMADAGGRLTQAGHAYAKHPTIAGHAKAAGGQLAKNLHGELVMEKYMTNGIAVRRSSDPAQVFFLDPNMSGHAVKVSLDSSGNPWKIDFLRP